MQRKPHLRVICNRLVAVPREESPAMAKARERFGPGRKFIHEHGTDFQRYPEPVLTRYFRKAEWRNRKRPDSK